VHKLITKHINDIEALGDIGGLNMEAISKALAKNRSLCVKLAVAYTYILKTSSPEPLKM
jgi:DNA repair protein RAD7